MNCPCCGKELTNVYVARSVELKQPTSNQWIEKNVFSATASCPNCHEELDDDVIDELGGNIHDWI